MTERQTDQREPCAKCPYRKDAPLAFWHPDHFVKLAEDDTKDFGPVYGCHNQNGNVCIGWALDQRRRGLPCFSLRVAMMRDDGLAKQVEEATDGGHEMFKSIKAMVSANLSHRPGKPRRRPEKG